MTTTRVSCPRDTRPPGVPPSSVARQLVFEMQRAGFTFSLREDGRGVRVRPGDRVSEHQRVALRGLFHEIRDVVRAELARPM